MVRPRIQSGSHTTMHGDCLWYYIAPKMLVERSMFVFLNESVLTAVGRKFDLLLLSANTGPHSPIESYQTGPTGYSSGTLK